jgi:hypothetical protein
MVLNNAARSRQEIIGPVLLPVLLAYLLKLGRYYEIRPLSRRLNFLDRKYFYRASFELCGLEKGHLAAVVLNELCVVKVTLKMGKFTLTNKKVNK